MNATLVHRLSAADRHHGRQHLPQLADQAVEIHDETELLTETADESTGLR